MAVDQIKEQAYVAVRGYRVAERSIRVQLVMIAAALALVREVACFFEIATMCCTARSVIPTRAATSRSRTSGSCAMQIKMYA